MDTPAVCSAQWEAALVHGHARSLLCAVGGGARKAAPLRAAAG
jgi:hypothetical protein